MEYREKNIYVLMIKDTVCEPPRYIELFEDKYNIKIIKTENEDELVDKALALLKNGQSIVIASELSDKNIEKILSETNPRKQFTAFNTIKSHQ